MKIEKEATIGDLKIKIERMTEIPAKIQLLCVKKIAWSLLKMR
jgi:hypothetical protein